MSERLTSKPLNRGRTVTMTLLSESETQGSVWTVAVLNGGQVDTSVILKGFSKAHAHFNALVAIWSR